MCVFARLSRSKERRILWWFVGSECRCVDTRGTMNWFGKALPMLNAHACRVHHFSECVMLERVCNAKCDAKWKAKGGGTVRCANAFGWWRRFCIISKWIIVRCLCFYTLVYIQYISMAEFDKVKLSWARRCGYVLAMVSFCFILSIQQFTMSLSPCACICM